MNMSLDLIEEQLQDALRAIKQLKRHQGDDYTNTTFVRFLTRRFKGKGLLYSGWKMLVHKRERSMCVMDGQGYKIRIFDEYTQFVEAPKGTYDLLKSSDATTKQIGNSILNNLADEKYKKQLGQD